MHDATVDRTTTGQGEVGKLTLADLRELKLKDAQGNATSSIIPTFNEVLKAIHGQGVLAVDVKTLHLDKIVQAIRESGNLGHAFLIVYTAGEVKRLRQAYPDVCLSAPAGSASDVDAIEAVVSEGGCIIAFAGVDDFNPELVERLHQLNVSVQVGTFSGRDQAARIQGPKAYFDLLDAGIDVLATDTPTQAKAALVAHGK
jgi:glycerophosphoryl diester phosphodiesterase